jgi:hypothetical protein
MGSFGVGAGISAPAPRPGNATGPGPSSGSLGRSSGASMWSTAAKSGTGSASPTLPNLPSHPTLNALITSASPQLSAGEVAEENSGGEGDRAGPRIGEPGKRMVAAGLGVRRPSASADKALSEVQKALGGVAIAE